MSDATDDDSAAEPAPVQADAEAEAAPVPPPAEAEAQAAPVPPPAGEPPPVEAKATPTPAAPVPPPAEAQTAPPPAAPPAGKRARVEVANRVEIGVLGWLARLYATVALAALVVAVWSAAVAYRYFAVTTPPAPDLSSLVASSPGISRTFAADGTKLDEFAYEWRRPVPYDQIPQQLIDAVVSIEDHQFFEHRGIYWKGIARAAWRNVVAGDFEQGGSTITQQVAKQLVGSDKSLSRKAHEAILAMRLERRNTKKAILSYYLNQIYLGGGAYGVAGAAERYFGKRLDELTLAEMALLAGLPKAPSAFSPLVNPDRALKRRNVVLDQMVRWGKLDAATAETAKAEPLRLRPYRSVFPDRLPYYANYIRTALLKHPRYGYRATPSDPAWVEVAGLQVETAAEPSFEAHAYDNVDYGTRRQDKRQGWRGPVWFVDGPARDTVLERQRALYGAGPLEPGRRYLAVVDDMGCDGGHVLIGDRRLELPLRNLRWAFPWSATDAHNDKEIGCASRALKRGDVVWVRREIRTVDRFREFYLPDGVNPAWQHSADQRTWDAAHADVVQLEQVPHPQGAIFTADHHTGYVTAMVGGYDFSRNEFNRAVQACRQPGSTYKPIYYAAAIDDGFGFDSMFYDRPVSIVDPVTGEVWTPENLHGTVDNDVTLEYALVFSKNIPSVAIFSEVGADRVEAWARRLGFTSEIIADKALALGASCTYLHELSRAFAIFARNGRWIDWTFLRRVRDRNGNVLEDNTVPTDPMLAPGDRLDRLAARGGEVAPQAISARTAFLTSKLLAQMVNYGFTKTLRATDLHAAGKTGTSSATMDTSFVAYNARFVTATWLGDDKYERELGKLDAAYMTVVPLWARYMFAAAADYPNPEIPWEVPPGVDPKDRGAHSKGRRGGAMSLIYRHAEKPPEPPPADGAPPA